MTLKNAFNHLVNMAEEKQNFHKAALLALAVWKNTHHTPPGPTLSVIRVGHEKRLTGTRARRQFAQLSRCSFELLLYGFRLFKHIGTPFACHPSKRADLVQQSIS